ncbi:hypothetical protein K2173_019918 [Erythroxylum novogranatense]|uniref:procollagen-proline 4-dioxygenase n=1 Tax=Erythroxylum novogranatense TaxID=1862640 RepID=A0AAV8UA06_9ROSI|nr:hypothetical protein K2173_019918 [Erythroxylum novogranatense]
MEKSPNFLGIFLSLLLFFSPFSQQVPKRGVFPNAFDPTRVTQLSWRPRAFLYEGFLSDNECDHLIDLDEIVDGVEERIAAWTLLPVENGEPLQILHYGLGQKYEPHFDFFDEETYSNSCGNRLATVLMYLSNISKGGETVFPMGDALLFFSLHPNATIDPMSLHGSCPVIEGEKWSATKWIHVRSLHMFERPLSKEDCVDENDMCRYWAKIGECEKNPLYMVGSDKLPGKCRESCNVCSSKD